MTTLSVFLLSYNLWNFFFRKSYGINATEFRRFLEELDSLINNEPVEDPINAAKYTEILQKLGYDSEKLMLEVIIKKNILEKARY